VHVPLVWIGCLLGELALILLAPAWASRGRSVSSGSGIGITSTTGLAG
jgi:hypothetical protein